MHKRILFALILSSLLGVKCTPQFGKTLGLWNFEDGDIGGATPFSEATNLGDLNATWSSGGYFGCPFAEYPTLCRLELQGSSDLWLEGTDETVDKGILIFEITYMSPFVEAGYIGLDDIEDPGGVWFQLIRSCVAPDCILGDHLDIYLDAFPPEGGLIASITLPPWTGEEDPPLPDRLQFRTIVDFYSDTYSISYRWRSNEDDYTVIVVAPLFSTTAIGRVYLGGGSFVWIDEISLVRIP